MKTELLDQVPYLLTTRLIPADGNKVPIGGKGWNKKSFTYEELMKFDFKAIGVITGVLPDKSAGILALDFDDCEEIMPQGMKGMVVKSPRANSCKAIFYLDAGSEVFELLQNRIPKNGRTSMEAGSGKLEIFWGENQSQVIIVGKHPEGQYRIENDGIEFFDEAVLMQFLKVLLKSPRRVGKVVEHNSDRNWDLMVTKTILEHPALHSERFRDYSEWLKVLMALKHTGERDGIENIYEELAYEWSQKVPNFSGYEAFEKQWNAIQNTHGDPRTLASLIHTAEELGVKVPKKKKVLLAEDISDADDAALIYDIVNGYVELDEETTSPDYLFLQEMVRNAEKQQEGVMARLPQWDDSWTKEEKKAWKNKANCYPVLHTSFRQACLENIVFNGASFQFEFKNKRGEDIEFDRIRELGAQLKNCRELPFFGKATGAHQSFADEVAKKNRYYPQQVYAKGLLGKWDGVDRVLGTLLNEVLKLETDFQKQLVLKWLKGTTERWLDPSCKFDHILILQGAQGIGKTSFFEALSPLGMFDTLQQLNTKDDYLALHRCAIVELGEVDYIFRRQDISKFKGTITKSKDYIRIPYGKSTHEFPRAFTLCGSVNNPVFLVDETGSRRFFVIPLDEHRIDWKWVRENRDQLWAQVMSLEIRSWLNEEEQHLVEENNNNFKVEGTIEPLVEAVICDRTLEQLQAGVWEDGKPLSTQVIFGIITDREKIAKTGREASIIKGKIPDIMVKLGFKHTRMTEKDKKTYYISGDPRVWRQK